jgi:hypothetical protein
MKGVVLRLKLGIVHGVYWLQERREERKEEHLSQWQIGRPKFSNDTARVQANGSMSLRPLADWDASDASAKAKIAVVTEVGPERNDVVCAPNLIKADRSYLIFSIHLNLSLFALYLFHY